MINSADEITETEISDFGAFYSGALRKYLVSQDEDVLDSAHLFSRSALGKRLTFSELASLHHRACVAVLETVSAAETRQMVARMEVFFLEVAAVYDMALKGYRQNLEQLHREIEERRKAEQELRNVTVELAHQRDQLDDQVRARTQELEVQSNKLRRQNARLVQTNLEQSDFTYAISHDLKSPNNTIRMILQILAQDYGSSLDEEARSLLTAALETADRMIKIIEDVLKYSQTLGDETQHETVSLAKTLQSIAEDTKADLLSNKGQLDLADLPDLICSPMQVRIMFQNFISNAIKFRRDGVAPRIEVFTEVQEDGGTDIVVRDNGIGIAEEHKARIFGLFQRLHTYDVYPGSGLGLALCQRVASNHGWNISITSKPGLGSSFRISINPEQLP
ncbi:ATP-binding protein [Pseudophaeobacter sp.]|jgi:signal transduction histidine kinase|uniref:ATP-binding protein n=1 Tax=unclassified Pseudophaeobacter TaxID=2637024 RepID=UPI0026390E30|nr:ATP-binding protein [Pseudophaeobacter sp.]